MDIKRFAINFAVGLASSFASLFGFVHVINTHDVLSALSFSFLVGLLLHASGTGRFDKEQPW